MQLVDICEHVWQFVLHDRVGLGVQDEEGGVDYENVDLHRQEFEVRIRFEVGEQDRQDVDVDDEHVLQL